MEFVDRLNRFPQGAPPSETLYKILEMLVSEREAQISHSSLYAHSRHHRRLAF